MGWKGDITENVVGCKYIHQVLAVCRAGAMAETGVRKPKAGILCYWRHLEPKRICFLFQQNGNWEAGTKFNIHQDTKYCTLNPYAAFSSFLKK